MSRHLIPFSLLLAVFLGLFFGAVNTPWLINKYGAQWLTEQLPGVTVDALTVRKQRWSFPSQLQLSGVSSEFRYRGKSFEFNGREVLLKGTFRALGKKEPMRVKVNGGDFKTKELSLRGANLELIFPFEIFRTKQLFSQGLLHVDQVTFQRYAAQKATVRFSITPEQLQILEATAAMYGGKFQSGQVSFKFDPGSLLISWSELSGLDAKELVAVNKDLFAGLSGKLNGSCRLVVDANKVEVLAIILSAAEQGIISPELLSRIAKDLPAGSGKQQLEQLIAQKRPLVYDQGTLYIQNIDPVTVALIVGVDSKADNLHIQERVIVPLPRGLREFLLSDSK